MTPREELLEDIDHIVAAYGQSRQETRRTLNKYAIGKWVPVSERLPERDARGNWTGIVNCRDGEIAPVIFNQKNTPVAIFTHWLELDMPEVETD